MKKALLKTVVVILSLNLFSTLSSKAETLSLFSNVISISNAPTSATFLGARWGVWDGTNFTQAVTSSANAGFFDLTGTGPEVSITLNQTNNSVYTPGTLLAVAIYGNNGVSNSSATNYSASSGTAGFRQAVLTNTSWTAPTFNNNANTVTLSFTGATAVVGSFASNTITMVPEPSTYALMALGGLVLFFIARRRKAQQA